MTESLVNPEDRQMDRHAHAAHPDSLAVFPEGVLPSYEETAVAGLAGAFAAVGLRPEERVLIVMPDGSGFEEAIIGTIRLAAVPLPVNPVVTASDLVTVASEAGSRLAVVAAERAAELADLDAAQVVPVDGPKGTWATVLLLG